MKVAVFSDVHGNIDAFETFVKDTKDVDIYICLGDVVNYGPYGNECVDLLESLPNAIKIIGNHEEAFINGVYEGSHPIPKTFFNYAYPRFDRLEKIKLYIDSYKDFGFTFVHTIFDTYIYQDSEIDFNSNYMVGHSHRQFKIVNHSNVLYNPGSLGQNRVNIEEGQYLILYQEKNLVEFKSLKVNIDKLIREMESLGYPALCTEYFLNKKCKK